MSMTVKRLELGSIPDSELTFSAFKRLTEI